MDDPDITLKIKGLPELNEKEYAEYLFDRALHIMLDNPTEVNILAFEKANKHLWEVKDAYRIGMRLKRDYLMAHPIPPRTFYTSYSETNQIH